jgi:cyclophilin family peptidyl-prolyl cis-trans isomerase
MFENITQRLGACLLALLTLPALAANPQVLMETSQGNITLELDAQRAPKTVANFLRYVDEGFYAGTIFHRVINGFMIQGGGMDAQLQSKSTHQPIVNEADNGLKNLRGTIAMARTRDPHSATAQFFINLKNNDFLNFRTRNQRGWGYTVFGRVVDGMSTVDAIAQLPTGMHPKGFRDVPKVPPVIERVSHIAEDTPVP